MNIGIFSASAPCAPSALTQALQQLTAAGHTYTMPFDPSVEYGTGNYLFSSASAVARIAAFHDLLNDDAVEAILCVRGAYGSQELLPYLPYDLIKRKNKPLIGMSDITALLWTIYSKTQIPTIHGLDLIHGFADNTGDVLQSQEWLFKLLRGEPRHLPNRKLEVITPTAGTHRSKVIAGNLTVFCSMAGTSHQPNFANHIVFLEEVGEPLFKVHRMLLQMREAGCFKRCAGIVLGYFSKCKNSKEQLKPSLEDIFIDIFKNETLPIWKGFPLGHEPLNYSLRYGEEIQIAADGAVTFL